MTFTSADRARRRQRNGEKTAIGALNLLTESKVRDSFWSTPTLFLRVVVLEWVGTGEEGEWGGPL